MKMTFVVPGPPVPCARPRFVRGHTITATSTRAYQTRVGWCAQAAKPKRWRSDWGSYRVHVEVHRAKDQGDADNFLKSIVDGAAEILFENDAAVHETSVVMGLDARNPRAVVEVEMLGDETREERRVRIRRERDRERRRGGE